MMNTKPQLTLLKAQASYRGDPTTIFHQLCGARPATLLLESAEINSKQNLQSLLVIDSALRITALGHTVSVQALTANGAALLPLLDEALPPEVRNQARPNGRELTFPAIDAVQDEDARLRSLSVFDALRTLLTLVDSPGGRARSRDAGRPVCLRFGRRFRRPAGAAPGSALPGLLLLSGGNPAGAGSPTRYGPSAGQRLQRAGE